MENLLENRIANLKGRRAHEEKKAEAVFLHYMNILMIKLEKRK